MKRVIAESLEVMKEGERKKQEEIFKTFRNTSFQDIVNNNTVRVGFFIACYFSVM